METALNIECEQNRSNCYKLLAACFYEPDFDAFTGEHLFDNLANELGDISHEAAEIARGMGREFSFGQLEAITVAHAKLFIGPFELAAPPYGSIYLEPGKMVMGKTTVAVQQMYHSAGLVVRKGMKEAPDHISFELEFMHFLCDKMINSIVQGNMTEASDMLDLQHEFHLKFLSEWVLPFCEKVIKNSEHEFYIMLGRCLKEFSLSAAIPKSLPGPT